MLMSEQPALFWGLIVSFAIGNIMLVILNIPLIGVWVSILKIPYRLLYPAIIIFVCIGSYSVTSNVFNVYMVAAMGVLGYLLLVLRYDAAPLLLGFVLGPLMEENMRRSLLLSRGDLMVFLDRPISLAFVSLTGLALAWSAFTVFRSSLKQYVAARERAA